MSTKRNRAAMYILIALSLVAIGAAIAACEVRSAKRAEAYEQGISFICEGEYLNARNTLYPLAHPERGKEPYEYAKELLLYAEARKQYAALKDGEGRNAADTMEDIPADYSGPLAEEVRSFRPIAQAAKDRYLEAEEERRIKEQEDYIRNLPNILPHIGMMESLIDRTKLGVHGDVGSNYETENGESMRCTLYNWYGKGGTVRLFTARVLKSVVIDVCKWNEDTLWDGDTVLCSIGGTPSHSASSPHSDPEEEPYGASDYSDPEDFYYDYYDDFFDYYEAEDYWYEYN